MATPVRIGVACPSPGERAAFLEWLDAAGYEPVPMLDLDSVARAFEAGSMEALIADAALVPASELPRVMRTLGLNRPLVLVGEPDAEPLRVPRQTTWFSRPVTDETLLLAVALALAEGRPARRFPRKLVVPLSSTVDDVAARVMDVSVEGVQFEVVGGNGVALPPYFTVRVPAFGVVARVRRVWVAPPGQSGLWCGGAIEPSLPDAAAKWQAFVDAAPTPAAMVGVRTKALPFL